MTAGSTAGPRTPAGFSPRPSSTVMPRGSRMGRPRQRRRRRAGNRPALDIPGTPSGGSHETSLLHAVVLAVGWGVLAFGAGYTWAYGPLLVFCATVGVVGLLSSPGMPHRAFAVALAAVVLAGALQVAPLPSAVVKTLSPARDTLEAVPERDFRPFDRFDPVRFRTGWPVSLSVAPSRTLLGLPVPDVACHLPPGLCPGLRRGEPARRGAERRRARAGRGPDRDHPAGQRQRSRLRILVAAVCDASVRALHQRESLRGLDAHGGVALAGRLRRRPRQGVVGASSPTGGVVSSGCRRPTPARSC